MSESVPVYTEEPFTTSHLDPIYGCEDMPIRCGCCGAGNRCIWVSKPFHEGSRKDRYECQKCFSRWEYFTQTKSTQPTTPEDIEITITGIDTNGSFVVEKLIIPGDSPCSVISQTAFREVFNPLQSLMNARPVRND